jgi:hypothetical protein
MVLIHMGRSKIYIIYIALTILFSCEEQGLFVKCDECRNSEPLEVELSIKLDPVILEAGPATLKIYEGNIEDNILVSTIEADAPDWNFIGRINTKYTFTATYTNIHGSTYTAVDSALPRVRYEPHMCKEPCYFVYDTKLDLRLKYQ